MTAWCHLPTIIKRRITLLTAGFIALCVALTTTLIFAHVSQAAPGINSTLNFQARLQTAGGAVVPDGYYNVQFKIYQDGSGTAANNPGGTLKWTESYVNNGGTGGVRVKNGYLSVSLGSETPFGTSVDWNQDTLWLSMNIAGSAAGCTTFGSSPCVSDGEMLPMKRLTSTPYAMNAGQLGGKSAENFVQLGQGVQTDASSNTPSLYINKTSTGNLVQLQNAGVDIFTIDNSGDLTFGNNTDHTLSIATANASTDGNNLTVSAGAGGSGTGNAGGTLVLQGGNAGGTNGDAGDVMIDTGVATGSGAAGTIAIGATNAGTVAIGNATSSTIVNGGSIALQSQGDTTVSTNGTQRARFSGSGDTLYVGNADGSGQATTANGFTIQGTSSTGANTQGGSLTLQAGSATNGNANGGNIVISGGSGTGTGANGLVVLSTPTFSTTTNDANCYTGGALVENSCTITAASVNNSAGIIIGFSSLNQTATLPDPTITTAGRVIYITAANNSQDFTLSANGGGVGNETAMRENTSATMVWNGSDWTVAGASNSTTLQSAYDNTLQSAGGAELIVSKTSKTNGLTIRDSSSNPVNGTLFNVETSSAAGLFAVNSNVTEYATDAGAEDAGASESTFPANTWSAIGSPTSFSRYTTTGNNVNTGRASVAVTTSATANDGVKNQLSSALYAGLQYNVSFTARLAAGDTFKDLDVYYSVDGTATSVQCLSGQQIKQSIWTKVNCTFSAPSSSITSSNAILLRQASATARTFYIDNLSVTLAANFSYTSDGSVNNNGTFATNWTTTGAGSTVTRYTADGYDASDSAQAVVTSGANAGVRNKLTVNPLTETLYRISTYAKVSSGTFDDFKIRYSRDGGTNFTDCVDYNTQTLSSSSWTQINCYITTDSTAATNPYIYFVQEASAARTFWVDGASMTLTSNSTPNVQIGGGNDGGPTTLFTLDKSATAPVSIDNDALLGSMYYDTTLGKLQCYEADGWGACGSAPDNIVTISPEYTNAVMHGTGVGTMTSDICSDALNINDATNGPAVCGTNETRNFYKWTSPQASSQSYSIYVTYQLPDTFREFASGSTSVAGKTDSNNASVEYQLYKSNSSGLTACGGTVSVATGNVAWQNGIASGTADPSTCGFSPGDSVVFKITVAASSNANAYLGNLGFTFSNY